MSLKIGIVGTGNVAQRNYVPCLAGQEDVALGYYNRTRAKAETVAAAFGGQVFESMVALADWQPDAIFVLTREIDRLETATALLELNPRRLFFEKPLVARHGQEDVREEDFLNARALLQDAAARNCETAMVFNYRFFDQSLRAKEIIAERSFGRAVNITGLVHYACWSHAIDLVHHFADPIVELTALQSAQERGDRKAARDVTAAFRTAADATGTLIATGALAWEFPLFELTFNFEGGRIHFRDLDGDMEVLDSGSAQHEVHAIARDRSRWDQYNASFAKSTTAYLESLRQGQPPPVPGVAGLQELQVEAAIKRSIAQNRPVDLAAELPLGLRNT
jgi:predicted dehydrogenase